MKDDLGDRMKLYESAEASRRLMPLLPVLARIDGRAFHSFTRGMFCPFDGRFSACMRRTTEALVRDTGACMGYTQSDEITLAWHSRTTQSQIWFDGRVAKMTSQLAAQATLIFYRQVLERMPEYADRMPTFDARVWSVPNRAEGANVFLWREWDATKNSLSMAAAAYYSHNDLMGKNGQQKHDMLRAKGVNWNDYPVPFKRGTYVQRRTVSAPISAEELDLLPPKHEARRNPALVVERSVCGELKLPPLATVKNREAVIFDGADAMVADDLGEQPCGRAHEAVATQADHQPDADAAALLAARTAVRDYYSALERREHGGVAQDKAFRAIERAIDKGQQR